MTAAEKTELFGFMATAEDWISGYRSDHSMPAFTDTAEPEEVAGSMHFSSIDGLERAVRVCRSCSLAAGSIAAGIEAVPGEGPAEATRIPVLVVGPAPGATDGLQGRPFAGSGGALLDKMLAAIKLSRSDNCYLTSLVKCAPGADCRPSAGDFAQCIPYLDAQLELLEPDLILALGSETARQLLGTGESLENLRGTFHEYRGIPLLVSFNPDDILADENLKRPAWEDLKLFRAELDRIWHNGSK